MTIRPATLQDMPGILALLKANHADFVVDTSDGFVTTNLTQQQLAALITEENGVTVAAENEKILAFALAASWKYWSEWPFFAYMIQQLPRFSFQGQTLTIKNSYQYGPVCVDASVRGTGIFEQVFDASLASMRTRFPIMATFVNQINPRSFAAHTRKAHMTLAGTFSFNQNDYYLLVCSTSPTNAYR